MAKYQLRYILILLVCWVVLLPQSKGQDIAHVIHKEEKDGLADRKVDHILRDIDGQFYVITSHTIQQYDGQKFDLIKEVPSSFDSDQIQLINNDSTTGSSILVQNNLANTLTLRTNQLSSISIPSQLTESDSSSDSVFISGNSQQLFYLYKQSADRYKVFDKSGFINEIKLESIPSKLYFDRTSSYFFAEWKDKTIKIIKDDITKEDNGKIVWFKDKITLCNRIGIYTWNNSTFEQLHKLDMGSDDILWAKADKKGNVLIALHVNIAKVNNLLLLKANGEIITYNNIISINDNIRDVYAEDFEDRMILATFNGLFVVNLMSKGIERIWHSESLAKSDFGAVITGITKSAEDVFFTKEAGGLYTIEEDDYSNLVPDNALKNISSITYNEAKNQVLISSYTYSAAGRLSIYDVKKKKLVKSVEFDFTPLSISSKNDSEIYITGAVKNRKYLNEDMSGKMIIYNLVKDEFREVAMPEKIKKVPIRAVYHEKVSGLHWIGTTSGCYVLGSDDSVQELNSAHVRMIKRYAERVFVGTKGDGVYVYDHSSKKLIKHLESANELTENSIISMEQDEEGNYWLASFRGITVLNKDLEVLKRIYEDEGLSNAEFNTMASVNVDNELYFGSINGLTKLNPTKLLSGKKQANIIFKRVDAWKNGKMESKKFRQGLKIKANLDSISFLYTSPDYYPTFHNFRKQDIKFSLNKESTVDFRDGSIHFGSLKLGEHKVGLMAGNESYTLAGQDEIRFRVTPYLLPWMIGAAILLLSLFIIWAFQKQRKQSEVFLQKEREEFDKQLVELELVALRAQMNPHFIFNALGAIQYFINTNDIARADEYLSKFAKLMRSILESSKSKFIKLDEEIRMLRLYASLEHIRFEEKFDFIFEVDEELEGLEFNIPSMIIQPIVENAINHGLYHLDGRMGELKISFRLRDDDTVECKVRDNGIGRLASANFRKKKAHKSRGMQIIKERIAALKKSNLYELEITCDDLKIPTLGTEVTILIHQNQ